MSVCVHVFKKCTKYIYIFGRYSGIGCVHTKLGVLWTMNITLCGDTVLCYIGTSRSSSMPV